MKERLTNVETEINPATLENETLAFLKNYWDSKRGGRIMPSRADIRASELKEHLGWVMIVDVLPKMVDFRYRLMGTLVAQYFLADGTGKTVTDFYSGRPNIGKAVGAMFRKCARERVVIRCFGTTGWYDRNFEEFDCVCLPLSDDGENVNMILHAFVFDLPTVLMSREVARTNGGRLLDNPPAKAEAR